MVDVPPAGQRVKLEVETRNGQTCIEGVVLHPAAKNHLTVKLVNGYNASYPLNEVTSVELLPTQSPPAATNAPKQERVTNDALPRVRILHTGGTIASKVDYTTGAVVA